MPKKVLKSNSKLPVIRACRFLRFYRRFACHPDGLREKREKGNHGKGKASAAEEWGFFRRVKICNILFYNVAYLSLLCISLAAANNRCFVMGCKILSSFPKIISSTPIP